MTTETVAPAKPTVVLVHGAFADSSSWNGVIAQLRKGGYPVIGSANPLRSLHGDAELLHDVLDSVDGPIVLAGHSYGGSVMSEAADGHPGVKALVFVASFLLDEGESTGELAGKFPGNELGSALDLVPVPDGNGGMVTDLYIQPDKFRQVFAADVPTEVAELMIATQRPITREALGEQATAAAWRTIPSWTLVTRPSSSRSSPRWTCAPEPSVSTWTAWPSASVSCVTVHPGTRAASPSSDQARSSTP